MPRPPKLSKKIKREMERKAAEEFFSRRSRPPTQFRSIEQQPEPQTQYAQPTAADLPRAGSVLSVEESRAIFARLASGDIKQVRR